MGGRNHHRLQPIRSVVFNCNEIVRDWPANCTVRPKFDKPLIEKILAAVKSNSAFGKFERYAQTSGAQSDAIRSAMQDYVYGVHRFGRPTALVNFTSQTTAICDQTYEQYPPITSITTRPEIIFPAVTNFCLDATARLAAESGVLANQMDPEMAVRGFLESAFPRFLADNTGTRGQEISSILNTIIDRMFALENGSVDQPIDSLGVIDQLNRENDACMASYNLADTFGCSVP